MKSAIKSEVQEFRKGETLKTILKEELLDGANVLTARFVLAIKSSADGSTKYKARYVIGGHRDKIKHCMVHGAQTLQSASARLLLALASVLKFSVWSADLKSAYLQSTESLHRRVFVRYPAKEFNLNPHECFELLKPFGLCDAGDLWSQTLTEHFNDDLGMIATRIDPS